jgi:hypothetical protein
LPVSGCRAWHEYGVNWIELDAPRHVFVPSVKGFVTLAERAGFDVAHIEFDGTPFEFFGSEQYRADIPMKSAAFLTWDRYKAVNGDMARQIESKVTACNADGTAGRAAFYLKRSDRH